MMKHLLPILGSASLLMGACTQDGPANPWEFDGDAGTDGGDVTECRTPTEWQPKRVENSDSRAPRGPMLTETHLVVSQSDSLRQLWVALDLQTEEVVWSSPPGQQVRAASGNRVLLFTETEEGQRVARIVDVSDSSEVARIDLSEDTRANPDYEPALKIFDGRRFVLKRRDAPDGSPGRVVYYDGSARRLVDVGARIQTGPVLIDGGFAAVVRNGSAPGERTSDVVVYSEGAGAVAPVTKSEAAERGLISDGSTAGWVTSSGVYFLRSAGSSASKVYDGSCGRISVDEGSLAFLCREEGSDNWPDGPASGTVLKYFDGERVRTVEAAEPPIYTVAVDDGRFVWIRPEEESEGFPAVGRETAGRLMVAWGYDAPAIDIGARSGFPCFSCSALWPPVYLSMGAGRVAWSYDRTDRGSEDPNARGGIGYAIPELCP